MLIYNLFNSMYTQMDDDGVITNKISHNDFIISNFQSKQFLLLIYPNTLIIMD